MSFVVLWKNLRRSSHALAREFPKARCRYRLPCADSSAPRRQSMGGRVARLRAGGWSSFNCNPISRIDFSVLAGLSADSRRKQPIRKDVAKIARRLSLCCLSLPSPSLSSLLSKIPSEHANGTLNVFLSSSDLSNSTAEYACGERVNPTRALARMLNSDEAWVAQQIFRSRR